MNAAPVLSLMIPLATGTQAELFQVLVDSLGHLKHVEFLAAKDWLQLVVGDDLALVLRVLELVLFNVCPNLFCDLAAWKRFGADDF